MSQTLCESIFRKRVLGRLSERKDLSLVVHPATFVRLRTIHSDLPAKLRAIHKDGLKVLDGLMGNKALPVLSNKAFPDRSSLREKSIDNMVHGGAGFHLDWTYGLLHHEDELCKRCARSPIAIVALMRKCSSPSRSSTGTQHRFVEQVSMPPTAAQDQAKHADHCGCSGRRAGGLALIRQGTRVSSHEGSICRAGDSYSWQIG